MQNAVIPIQERAERFVAGFYPDFIDENYLYHNLQHAQDVVEAVRRLGNIYVLSQVEMEMLELAAWFHDTGFRYGPENHEEHSAGIARNFLEHEGYPEIRIHQIESLILATRRFAEPENLLEQIIRDADYSHLGSELYWDRCSRIRQELLMTRHNFMPEEEWVEFELDFMAGHRFHTEAAQQLLEATKQKNIRQLLKYRQRIHPGEEVDFPKKKKKKKNANGLINDLEIGRGVETMFRTTYRTHINLSAIADNKANIMLSISAIILSIAMSSLLPKFDANHRLIFPTLILLAVCLATLVFAILATRPNITHGSFTRQDILEKRSNLLFFGNFHKMPIEDFHWGMMEMIRDSDFLYSSMTRDIYFLGKVLAQKYRYLRLGYAVFMIGMVVSVLAFGIALLL